jgi:hypothetical protein
MKLVSAFIQSLKLEAVQEALGNVCFGRRKGQSESDVIGVADGEIQFQGGTRTAESQQICNTLSAWQV